MTIAVPLDREIRPTNEPIMPEVGAHIGDRYRPQDTSSVTS